MRKQGTPTFEITIGKRRMTYAEAAFIAVKAERLGRTPLQIRQVSIPEPLPERIQLAGHVMDIPTAAKIAELAARRGATPGWVVCNILEKWAAPARNHPTRTGHKPKARPPRKRRAKRGRP